MCLKAKIIIFVFMLTFSHLFAFAADTGPTDYFYRGYNVVLITICSLRADHLSCYGYPRNTSPNIDKLAKEGILFENAFAQGGGYTLPSLISIHTSLYPQSHGVIVPLRDKLSNKVETLAEVLKRSGYKTAFFARLNNPHTYLNTGLGRGFEDTKHFAPEHDLSRRQKIFKWLKEVKDSPHFVNIHLAYLHFPYCPPLEYKQKFSGDYKGSIIDTMQGLKNFQFELMKEDLKNPDSEIKKILRDEISFYPEIFKNDLTHKKFGKLQQLVKGLPM